MHEAQTDLNHASGFECRRCHRLIWWSSALNKWVTREAPATEVCAGNHR
jgi:hypothetical protein